MGRKLEMHNGRIYGADALPWCPECEHVAVPDDDGNCGDCGATIEYRSRED